MITCSEISSPSSMPTIRPSREDRESTGRGEPSEERETPPAEPSRD